MSGAICNFYCPNWPNVKKMSPWISIATHPPLCSQAALAESANAPLLQKLLLYQPIHSHYILPWQTSFSSLFIPWLLTADFLFKADSRYRSCRAQTFLHHSTIYSSTKAQHRHNLYEFKRWPIFSRWPPWCDLAFQHNYYLYIIAVSM